MTTRVKHVQAKMKYPVLSSLSKAFLSSSSSFLLANLSCEKQNKISVATDSKLTEQCDSLTYASNLRHIAKRCEQQALRRGRGNARVRQAMIVADVEGQFPDPERDSRRYGGL